MKIRDVSFDPVAQVEGVWVKYLDTDMEFLTGRLYSPRFVEELRRQEDSRKDSSGNLSEEAEDDAAFQAVIRTVFLGWRNVEDENGDPMPYTIEMANELFRDKRDQYGHIFLWWVAQAGDRQKFLAGNIEASGKKPSSSSTGKRAGGRSSDNSRNGRGKTTTPESSHTVQS